MRAKMWVLSSAESFSMSFNLLSASLSMFWYSLFFTRKSSVTLSESAILAAVSIDGLISSRSYLPLVDVGQNIRCCGSPDPQR